MLLIKTIFCFALSIRQLGRSTRDLSTRLHATKPQKQVSKQIIHEETIKKSKFIAFAAKASTMEEAMKYLDSVKDVKATHNCWAFNSVTCQRCSDDGEPSGTGGRPILVALEKENIINSMVVVTRYYGGIKLGTGGLARAYGGTAQTALKLAEKEDFVPCEVVSIALPQSDIGIVYRLLKPFQLLCSEDLETEIKLQHANFEERDQKSISQFVTVSALVPTNEIGSLREKFDVICQGRGSFHQAPNIR